MDKAIDNFRQNFRYVRSLGDIYRYIVGLGNQGAISLALDEILRSEIVHGVSCLDTYIHELVQSEIVEIYCGNRPKPKKYEDITISLDSFSGFLLNFYQDLEISYGLEISVENLKKFLTERTRQRWLENEIAKTHRNKTFQGSRQIEAAIQLISDVKLWQRVGEKLNMSPSDVKDQLDVVVRRRNQIVHEADIDTSLLLTFGTREKYPINRSDVDKSLEFIEDFSVAVSELFP
jgi:hypothetical protein